MSAPTATELLHKIKELQSSLVTEPVQTQPSAMIQPDVDGKFPTPLDGALFMASLGIPQTPLRPRTKEPFLPEFQKSATADPVQIRNWAQSYPNCNFGSVGREGEYFVFEADSTEVRKRFAAIGGQFTAKLAVSSRPDNSRGHRWYRSTPDVKNIQQGTTKYSDFSIRAKNMQCVSPGSYHPETGEQYRLISAGVPEVPTAAEIAFWESERVEKNKDGKPEIPRNERGLVPHGSLHTFMLGEAGRLRGIGLGEESIRVALRDLMEKNAEPPVDWALVDKMASSICSFPAGDNRVLALTQQSGQPTQVTVDVSEWRSMFRAVGELEAGEPRMLINNFLPEGIAFIGAYAGEGKTLLGLSIAKALTTGKNFLGQYNFSVPEVTPTLYLIPESGGRAFRKRCETFQIPNDPELFLARTISEGGTLLLNNPWVLEAVKVMKPVVILDTLIRFSEADDENQASQNKQMVDDIIRLRQAGAIGVIGMHHATKAMREKGMSLETALRGTGDIAAAADAVYGMLRDSKLYADGSGPNEIDVVCLKPRDFEPPKPFRIAASEKSEDVISGMPLVVSVIDRLHDFRLIPERTKAANLDQKVAEMVSQDPNVSRKILGDETGASEWEVRQALKRLGIARKSPATWQQKPENGLVRGLVS